MKEGSPKYWMISKRNDGGIGTGVSQHLTYWINKEGANGEIGDISNWTNVTSHGKDRGKTFKSLLAASVDQFPTFGHENHERQSHVTLFIHGYNESFYKSATLYGMICEKLFGVSSPENEKLGGFCVLYDWPSMGHLPFYLPDRSHARQCAEPLADVLGDLFDYLLKKQRIAAIDPSKACKAKVSVIAHSMGNYVLQKALAVAWTRKNQPLLVTLVNQLVMVAADVDNDIFDAGSSDNVDGSAMINLTYRITSLFSGRDAVLGDSAGLKHFGTRRLGRSGLASRPPLNITLPRTDNVWDIDCSSFFPNSIGSKDIHGAYFDNDTVIDLMIKLLRGIDRNILSIPGHTKSNAWPQ